MKKIGCLILAAGYGKRANAIKPLLKFGNQTYLSKTYHSLKESGSFSNILIVTGYARADVEKEAEKFGAKFVFNPDFAKGMHSSIRNGLSALRNVDAVCISLSDQPHLDSVDYQRIVFGYQASAKSLARPRFNGEWGNPAIFSTKYKDEIFAEPDTDRGCHYLFERYPHEIEFVEMTDDRCLKDFDFGNSGYSIEQKPFH